MNTTVTTDAETVHIVRHQITAITTAEQTKDSNGRGRRKPLILDGADAGGMLFVNSDGSLGGAVRFHGETFQVTAERKEGSGKAYWVVVGQGSLGNVVHGRLDEMAGGLSRSGKPLPNVGGQLTITAGAVRRHLAGWTRTTAVKHRTYYGMRIKPFAAPKSPEVPLFACEAGTSASPT